MNATNAAPTDEMLEAFKSDVRSWIEIDNSVRRLQAAIKERRLAKKQLSERIIDFMARFNIDDLHTRECRLRYHVTYVRNPITYTTIKDRIANFFVANVTMADSLNQAIFGSRDRAQRSSIRRLLPK